MAYVYSLFGKKLYSDNYAAAVDGGALVGLKNKKEAINALFFKRFSQILSQKAIEKIIKMKHLSLFFNGEWHHFGQNYKKVYFSNFDDYDDRQDFINFLDKKINDCCDILSLRGNYDLDDLKARLNWAKSQKDNNFALLLENKIKKLMKQFIKAKKDFDYYKKVKNIVKKDMFEIVKSSD